MDKNGILLTVVAIIGDLKHALFAFKATFVLEAPPNGLDEYIDGLLSELEALFSEVKRAYFQQATLDEQEAWRFVEVLKGLGRKMDQMAEIILAQPPSRVSQQVQQDAQGVKKMLQAIFIEGL